MSHNESSLVVSRRGADRRAVTLLWAPATGGSLVTPTGLPSHWQHVDCAGDCVARLGRVHQPHVIVYELDGAREDFSNLHTLVHSINAAVIFAARKVTPELLSWAIRQRVWDVLPLPLHVPEVRDSVLRYLNAERRAMVTKPRTSARTSPITEVEIAKPKRVTLPAIEYVEQHFSHNIDVDTAAALCGLCRSHFSRMFAKEHGVPFRDFVLQHRIAVAKHWLARPDVSIADVAATTGFSDHSYFSRNFKRLVGKSPSAFRR